MRLVGNGTFLLLTIVLPIFNESANLPDLFGRLEGTLGPTTLYRIVAVDDGSTDESPILLASIEKKLPMTVITHAQKQGLGMAIRTGLMEALRITPADGIIVTMDADEELHACADRGYGSRD